LKFYDLFCGIGGFRLGLQKSGGFEYSGSCEIDKYSREIYKKNFGDYPSERDIREVDPSLLPDFDLLTAGFPCQPFSIAGKGKGFKDERGNLFFEILKIIKEKKPKILFLENVRGLLSNDGGRTFSIILSNLSRLGYDIEWQVINGRYFVPQKRSRIFIIGHLRERARSKIFPIGEEIDEFEASTILKEGQKHKIVNCIDANYFKRVDKHGQRTVLAFPINYVKRNQKNVEDSYYPTLDTLQSYAIYDGFNYRMLTPLECERIMGFPDGWTIGQSDQQRYKMLGNSVIPQIIETIGKKILKCEKETQDNK
jgi:DNA (cytosine-5)-methyltransferase 1